nr:protein FAM196B-like [Dromaius novaehollandiae]
MHVQEDEREGPDFGGLASSELLSECSWGSDYGGDAAAWPLLTALPLRCRRRSYRTGQDIANCGTCRDCACIIYSVEHDFRQQEGRFQRVLSGMESAASPGCPAGGQEPAPASKLPAKLDSKKSRRKCFWFL